MAKKAFKFDYLKFVNDIIKEYYKISYAKLDLFLPDDLKHDYVDILKKIEKKYFIITSEEKERSEYKIVDLVLGLTVSHAQSSQLAAALHSPWPTPTGTHILLFDGVGGDRAGFANLTLSDRASRPITEVTDIVTPVVSLASTDVPKAMPVPVDTVTSTLVITNGPLMIADVDVTVLTGRERTKVVRHSGTVHKRTANRDNLRRAVSRAVA